MSSWDDVAARTERVYRKVSDLPEVSLVERIKKVFNVGIFAGILAAFLVASDVLFWRVICFFYPAHAIEVAVDFPRRKKSAFPSQKI